MASPFIYNKVEFVAITLNYMRFCFLKTTYSNKHALYNISHMWLNNSLLVLFFFCILFLVEVEATPVNFKILQTCQTLQIQTNKLTFSFSLSKTFSVKQILRVFMAQNAKVYIYKYPILILASILHFVKVHLVFLFLFFIQ